MRKRNYKNVNSLKGRVSVLTLENLMHQRIYLKDHGWVTTNNLLTDELTTQVCDLLGGQKKTKERMFHVIKRGGFSKWYLERIMYSFTRKCFTYCAGQDYPEEIKDIRKDLTNKY